jgi:hypothetical protein
MAIPIDTAAPTAAGRSSTAETQGNQPIAIYSKAKQALDSLMTAKRDIESWTIHDYGARLEPAWANVVSLASSSRACWTMPMAR